MSESKPTKDEMFRTRLRQVRQAQGLTQAELAARAEHLGASISGKTISAIEGGSRNVRSLDNASALARALGYTLDDFLATELSWEHGPGLPQLRRDLIAMAAQDLVPEIAEAMAARDRGRLDRAFRAFEAELRAQEAFLRRARLADEIRLTMPTGDDIDRAERRWRATGDPSELVRLAEQHVEDRERYGRVEADTATTLAELGLPVDHMPREDPWGAQGKRVDALAEEVRAARGVLPGAADAT